MSSEIDAAFRKAMNELVNQIQAAMVQSRLTGWTDVFLVGKIIREEVVRYAEYGHLIDPMTLKPTIPKTDLDMLVVRCIEKFGEERNLDYEKVQLAIRRVVSNHP